MKNKIKVQIQFERKVSYQVEIEVTKEQFEMLENVDGWDLGERHIDKNDAYYFIRDYAEEGNEFSLDEDLYNIEVNEID